MRIVHESQLCTSMDVHSRRRRERLENFCKEYAMRPIIADCQSFRCGDGRSVVDELSAWRTRRDVAVIAELRE